MREVIAGRPSYHDGYVQLRNPVPGPDREHQRVEMEYTGAQN